MADKLTLSGRCLTRNYGSGNKTQVVLREVSLDLHAGETTLLMGPSGSGKTTLLALLSGLLRPDTGQVLALGRDIWQMSERQREEFRLHHCGFIFQGHNLYPALTARQQLEMLLCWGQELTLEEARPRVADVLDRLHLAHRSDARPGQLSGGEKQRVAIGRALVKAPTFCFADEPTSALDWDNGRQAMDMMRAAAYDWGTTVLVVGHDPRLIPLVDRVYHLENGRMVEPVKN